MQDRGIEWKRNHLYIPVTTFSGLRPDLLLTGGQGALTAIQVNPDSAAGVIGKTTATNFYQVGATSGTDKNIRMMSPGAANGNRLVGINGTNITGLLLTTAGDFINHFMMWPSDLDWTQDIGFRAIWACDAAAVGARTITWLVKYNSISSGVAAADPTNALDTTIGVDVPVGTAGAIQRGLRGILAKNSANMAVANFGVLLHIEMNAFNAALVENKYLVGLEIDYMPRRTIGVGNLHNVNPLANYLDRITYVQ